MPSDARILLCRTLHRDNEANPDRYSLIENEERLAPTLMTGSNDSVQSFVVQGLRTNVEEFFKYMCAARDCRTSLVLRLLRSLKRWWLMQIPSTF